MDFVFEVFVPNGTPTHTYVKRTEEKNERKLADGLAIPKMVISISGSSKTGKTALVDKLLTADRIIKGSSFDLNRFCAFSRWFSAVVTRVPLRASAG